MINIYEQHDFRSRPGLMEGMHVGSIVPARFLRDVDRGRYSSIRVPVTRTGTKVSASIKLQTVRSRRRLIDDKLDDKVYGRQKREHASDLSAFFKNATLLVKIVLDTNQCVECFNLKIIL